MLTDIITAFVGQYLDPRDLIAWLLTFQLFDILTGVVASARERKLNSSIAWNGVWKKVATALGLTFIVVSSPFISAYSGGIDLHIDVVATLAFVLVEAGSIVENLGRAGVKTEFLSQWFEKVKPPSVSSAPSTTKRSK